MNKNPNSLSPKTKRPSSRFAKATQSFRKKHPRIHLIFRVGLWSGIFLFVVTLGFTLAVYFGAFGRLPGKEDLKKINTRVASEVYSADGKLIGKYYLENRIFVDIDSISPHVIHALVATEDERFFKHKGVDFRSLSRVFFKTILMGKNTGGGSTISQQLIKNIFKRQDHGFFTIPITKLKEIFISRRLEKVYSKDELLELYLNTVPFGNRIFGIEVASNRYFGKHASQLRVEEAALLVGMLKGTGTYSPIKHPKKALKRRNIVLNQLERNGYLSKDKKTKLQNVPLKIKYHKEGSNEGVATYFRERVRQDVDAILKQLEKEDGSPYNLYTDGLKIYTTIDSKIQAYAENAVQAHMSRLQKLFDKHWKRRRKPWTKAKSIQPFIKQSDRYKKLQAQGVPIKKIYDSFLDSVHMQIFTWKGLRDTIISPKDSVVHYLSLLNSGVLALDTRSGAVKAWVGGIDFHHLKYDHVKAKRQVGSTFKPLIYAAALRAGHRPCEYISNDSLTMLDENNKYWTPNNAEGHYGGYYSMSGALAHSVNVAAVRMVMEAGIAPVISLAQINGFQSTIPKVPSIALGSMNGSLEEMVTLYSTFARKGQVKEPFFLTKIETADGKELIKFDQKKNFVQGMSPATSALMTNMLEMVVDSGTARRLHTRYHLPSGIAGKTGTTQGQSDGWFIGYTPGLVMGVWVGGEIPAVRFRSLSLGQGANTALPIWGLTMQQITKDKRLRRYRPRPFPALPDSLAQLLDCPSFVESLIIEEPEVKILPGEEGILDKVLRERRERIRKRKEARKHKKTYPRKTKKKKKWWQKVFGRRRN
ncbi:MAG TPA: penicillin-binding protein [Saprospiraceae bacterium]|nr:penicillin-binding protein [Saprospiraceae bacterium]